MPFHRSIRKQQRQNPKFYFFDLGVKRALDRTLDVPLKESAFSYGEAFEHFVIAELMRLGACLFSDWRYACLATKDGAEIDLIIDRPGQAEALIEIKSTTHVTERDVSALNRFTGDFSAAEAYCISRDPNEKKIGNVLCLPFTVAFAKLGL